MTTFLYKKLVDWSLLKEGFGLPLAVHPLLRTIGGLHLEVGEKRQVMILIDRHSFKVQLNNLNFDREKYPDHKEIIQIRYSPTSELTKYFRLVFSKSYASIVTQKELKGKRLAVNSETPEYFCLYATDIPGVFQGEVITAGDVKEETEVIQHCHELEWENSVNAVDESAHLVLKTKLVKLRHMDRSIAEGLKILYENRCQVCGCSFKVPYGSGLIHAHHIAPFTTSLNNNPENIMILCPNHHYVVHDVHPVFDFDRAAFCYANGLVEPLKVNYHLGKRCEIVTV